MRTSEASEVTSTKGPQPRAMIHKKILEAAESNPDASYTDLAEMVSGASEGLVERVIDEYGDPAEADTSADETKDDKTNSSDTTGSGMTDITDSVTNNEISSTENINEETNKSSEQSSSEEISKPETNSVGNQSAMLEHSDNDSDTIHNETVSNSKSETETEEKPVTDLSELNNKKRETLKTVYQNPTATQEEVANSLNVSRATISKRVNDIPGFDWNSRQSFVEGLIDDVSDHTPTDQGADTDQNKTVEDLESRVSKLEKQVQNQSNFQGTSVLSADLMHKVVHACMDAEYFSKEEELQLLRKIL